MGSNANIREALLQAKRAETGDYLASCALADLDEYLAGALTQVLIADVRIADVEEARYHMARTSEILQQGRSKTQRILQTLPLPVTHMEQLDLNSIVRKSVRNYLTWAPEEVELELDLSPTIPAIRGDRAQWEKMLLCLLVNATLLARNSHHSLRIVTAMETVEPEDQSSGLTRSASEQLSPSERKVGNGEIYSHLNPPTNEHVCFRINLTQHAIEHQRGVFSLAHESDGSVRMIVRLPAADLPKGTTSAAVPVETSARILLAFTVASPDRTYQR